MKIGKLGATGIVTVLAVGGFFGYKTLTTKPVETRYVLGAVARGTLVTSISGSGQVSLTDQVDLKPKVSGDILTLAVKNGQEVKLGQAIAWLNARDALKAVRDAQTSLETANLSLERLSKPADSLTTMRAENAITQAKESKTNSEADLKKSYEDGFNTVSDTYLDLPALMTGLDALLYTSTLTTAQWNIDYYADAVKNHDSIIEVYRNEVNTKYQTARAAYDASYAHFKTATRFSDTATIESLINETYDTTRAIAEAVKSADNYIQFYKDSITGLGKTPNPTAATHIATLNGYVSQTNGHLVSLLSIKQSIQRSKDGLVGDDRSIAENTASLAALSDGPDSFDLRSAQLNVRERQNSLQDAREKLADYVIRAPFAGIIAKVSAKVRDSVSSGTVIATLITKQRTAEISLNEVDVSKVKVGEKVTFTFDAIPDLQLTGQVADIDALGTVSQGVVTYVVKITFDAQDDRVKPGMSVTAAIMTDVRQNALLVPNSALKTTAGVTTVGIMDAGTTTPRQQPVTVGLSNDTSTEILSGLNEGDQIVTRTITSTSTTAKATAPSLFPTTGGTRGAAPAGGNARFQSR